jgi:MFS family permease
MLTSLGLAILSSVQARFPVMYVCLALVGVARAFNVPARWALLPQLIPLEMLPSAVAWNSSGFQIANVAGPAVGGCLLAWLVPFGVYVSTALCLLCCVGLLSTIRPRRVARLREPLSRRCRRPNPTSHAGRPARLETGGGTGRWETRPSSARPETRYRPLSLPPGFKARALAGWLVFLRGVS